MILNVTQLRNIFEKVLKEIETREIKTLDKDYYWSIDGNDRFNLDVPAEVVTGSLEDDWERLVASSVNGEVFTPVDVERLGNILVAISEKMSNADS